jgi:hypothetical protein
MVFICEQMFCITTLSIQFFSDILTDYYSLGKILDFFLIGGGGNFVVG